METKTVRCYDCGSSSDKLYTHYDEVRKDHLFLCSDCLAASHPVVACDACHETGDLIAVDGEILCFYCLDERFPGCPSCGERAKSNLIQKLVVNDVHLYYCPNCAETAKLLLLDAAATISKKYLEF